MPAFELCTVESCRQSEHVTVCDDDYYCTVLDVPALSDALAVSPVDHNHILAANTTS